MQVKMQIENEIIRAEHSQCQLLSRLDARHYTDVQGLFTAKHKAIISRLMASYHDVYATTCYNSIHLICYVCSVTSENFYL